MAYSDVNFSPLLNKVLPRLILRRVATTSSNRSRSWLDKPMGMQSSRKLQLEHATLIVSGFMAFSI
jgi:hypothetical protein